MADEVERLVVAPFKEIVEKGNVAIENAARGASQDVADAMLKAAQSLVKEGERAVKRIEPLCSKAFDDYGSNFVDAIKENDEIAEHRSVLQDLLWDFDEVIEVDGFEAAKFDQLQRASRKAAPKVMDILKRMKLTSPVITTTSSQSSRIFSLIPDTMAHAHQEQVPTSTPVHPPPPTSPERLIEETEEQLITMMGATAGPDEGLRGLRIGRDPRAENRLDRSNTRRSETSEAASEFPPRPPSADPWKVGRTPPFIPDEYSENGDKLERRAPVAGDSPTIPYAQPVSPTLDHLSYPASRRTFEDAIECSHKDQESHERHVSEASRSFGTNSEGSMSPVHSKRWTNSTQGSTDSGRSSGQVHPSQNMNKPKQCVPRRGEDVERAETSNDLAVAQLSLNMSTVSQRGSPVPTNGQGLSPADYLSIPSGPFRHARDTDDSANTQPLHKPSTESINSSVFDIVDYMDPTSSFPPTSSRSLRSAASSNTYAPSTRQPPPRNNSSTLYHYPSATHSRSSTTTTIRHDSSSNLTVRPSHDDAQSNGGIDQGLIPVDTDDPLLNGPLMPSREPDCGIDQSSSFYKLKGFCKGAEEARRGQRGYKKIKRPVGGFSMAVVAKCNHCLYELDFKSVEQDWNNEPASNFSSNGVGFRLRVLQKSHLQVRHVDEQLYGCLFCIEQGQTIDESDATVFFNQRQLFAHMARHTHPLPQISGVTVVEEPELPPDLAYSFDLHFARPPLQSVMAGIAREVSRLPVAVALETRKVQHGIMRSPPDRTPSLHFAIGARIVGIEFPAKYEGKWAMGWHDGLRGAFEVDSVQFGPPPKGEVKMQGTSHMQAAVRWKWNQKGDEKWLKLDKGDMVKNISWTYPDHWCWSGTTSKGWGIFPQSHLDPASLRTSELGDGGTVSGWEKRVPLRFNLRRTTDQITDSVARSRTRNS
ncbi:hypothetical protein F4780DRAFT_305804 [Xylariomycetidae sp. FL0641]|nr:hypothetical protein F4780DRAFT_305804 [Xylariomycetidae sp. FL0641]